MRRNVDVVPKKKIEPIKPKEEEVTIPNSKWDRNEEMKQVFKIFDKDGDNRISRDEIGSLLRSLGREPSEEEIGKLITDCDKDQNGTIELSEFIAYMDSIYVVNENKLEEVVQAFKIFDRDDNGWISAEEFKNILMKFGGDFTEREVNEIFNESDLNHDGKLAYAEFVDLWKYQ